MKKAFAWFFLILILGTSPLLLALWWIFPILAGVVIWVFFKSEHWKLGRQFLKPVSLVLLLIFSIWLVWIYRRHVQPSYESTSAAFLVRRIAPLKSPQLQKVEIERRGLMDEITLQRIKIADISHFRSLYRNADHILVSRNGSGMPDEFGISSAMSNLSKEFAAHKLLDETYSLNFLQPNILQDQMDKASQILNKIQDEAIIETDPAKVLEKKYSISDSLRPYQVDRLYFPLSDLQTAVRRTLKLELKAELTRTFAYDSSDTLSQEQRTVISLGGQKAVGLESTGLLSLTNDPQLTQQITYAEDSYSAQKLEEGSVVPLHSETKQITITQRVVQSSASYRLVTDRLPVAFRAVDLRWVLPLSSRVVVNLRLPQGETWGFPVPLETTEADSLQSVRLPRHAFFYSEDLQPVSGEESDAKVDLLVPSSVTPKVRALAAGKSIHIEILPQYLRFQAAQKYKQYFILENMWTALIISIISAVVVAIVSPPK